MLQTTALLNQALFEKMKKVYPLDPDEDARSRIIDLNGEDISLIKRLINGIGNIESRKRNNSNKNNDIFPYSELFYITIPITCGVKKWSQWRDTNNFIIFAKDFHKWDLAFGLENQGWCRTSRICGIISV